MQSVHEYQSPIVVVDALIDISADDDLSVAVDLGGLTLVAIQYPSAMTSSNATFSVSVDGTNYFLLTGVSSTITVNNQDPLTPAEFAGVRYVKVITDGNEAADRTLGLVCRPV